MLKRHRLVVMLNEPVYEQLAAEAARQGAQPAALATELLQSALGHLEPTPEIRRRELREALDGLAHLRETLPGGPPIDVVKLIHEGREELDRRMGF
jgi:hypothetical protein